MLKHVDACIEHVAPLSPIAMEALSVLAKREVDAIEVVAVLGKDPLLAARVLRLANSPFYGCSGRIATLREAFIVLGTRTLYQAVMAAAVMNNLGADQVQTVKQWRHSLGVARAARVVAQSIGSDEEIASTAGLLHDIGRIVLSSCVGNEYNKHAKLEEPNSQLTEQEIFGVDHASVGAKVALRWRLPSTLVEAIARHHTPDDGEVCPLVDIVHVADVLAHAVDEKDEQSFICPIATGAWQRIGIAEGQLPAILDAIDGEPAL